MNEFIVWDSKFKKFIEPSREIVMTTKDEMIKGINGGHGFVEEWSIFPYIGKTDDTPEQNKIYADCSVFEFEYLTDDGWVKLSGYFSFDDIDLRYEVNVLKDITFVSLSFYEDRFRNLKVIGTLQEDKHLMGDK